MASNTNLHTRGSAIPEPTSEMVAAGLAASRPAATLREGLINAYLAMRSIELGSQHVLEPTAEMVQAGLRAESSCADSFSGMAAAYKAMVAAGAIGAVPTDKAEPQPFAWLLYSSFNKEPYLFFDEDEALRNVDADIIDVKKLYTEAPAPAVQRAAAGLEEALHVLEHGAQYGIQTRREACDKVRAAIADLKAKTQSVRPSTLTYTTDVGAAGEKYFKSFGDFEPRTPATFRWHTLFDAMVAAAEASSTTETAEPAPMPIDRATIIDVLLATQNQSEGVTADAIIALLTQEKKYAE